MDKYLLAKKVDKTVPNFRWVASLSNGETIYENHIKGEPAAWERLAQYVEDKGLSITKLRIQGPGFEVNSLPANQEGYLQKKVAWSFGGHPNNSGLTCCIGYVQGDGALLFMIDAKRGSTSQRTKNPGPPWVIYSKEKREELYAVAN